MPRKAEELNQATEGLAGLVGDSPVMQALRSMIRRIAESDSTVLILGESGTGKELVAQSIHQLSNRQNRRFIPVNCGAIPHELLESELFGHKKGSFTGAAADRKGRFELAHEGTIFLDEIGDMRADMQVKLLRVLQERKIDRVGDELPVAVNVRVIAATHRNLQDAINSGGFREDLFYRLNVVPLIIPPLRERGRDVLTLFHSFAHRCKKNGHAPIKAAPDLSEWLQEYLWPGNCRELLNFVERLTVFWPGEVLDVGKIPQSMLPDHRSVATAPAEVANELQAVLNMWPEDESEEAESDSEKSTGWMIDKTAHPAANSLRADSPAVDLKQLLAAYEASWIREAMRLANGNITRAAELLGLPRTTMIERLRKYEPSISRQPD